MYTNVSINEVNVSVDPHNLTNGMILLIKLNTGITPQDIEVVGAKVEMNLLGFILSRLLATLNSPTLEHLKNQPARLKKDGDGSWSLIHFLNDEQIFDIGYITDYVATVTSDEYRSRIAGESTDPTPLGG